MTRYEPYYDITTTHWGIIARDEIDDYWYVEQPATLKRAVAEAAVRGLSA